MQLTRIHWALTSAALMILGGFGPWATVLGFSVAGTHGDGWFVIVGGLIAGGMLLWRGNRAARVIALLAALVGGAVSIYDMGNVNSVADGTLLDQAVSPGWGLYLSLLASLSLLAASITLLRERPAAAGMPA